MGKVSDFAHLKLEPAVLPPRTVARVPSLGDDALELKLAGVTIDGFTVVHFEMLDVDDFRRGCSRKPPRSRPSSLQVAKSAGTTRFISAAGKSTGVAYKHSEADYSFNAKGLDSQAAEPRSPRPDLRKDIRTVAKVGRDDRL